MGIASQDHDVTGRIARFLSSRKGSVARVGEGETDFSSAGARSSAFVACRLGRAADQSDR